MPGEYSSMKAPVAPGPPKETSPQSARPAIKGAPLVVSLVVLNTIAFVLLVVTEGSDNVAHLLSFGALFRPLVSQGEYWRVLTVEFLHGGILHLVVNTYSLWALGRLLEPLYGTFRFGVIYFVSAISASLLSMSLHEVVSVGASGAIFGLAGAMLVAGWRYKESLPTSLAADFGKGALPFVFYNLAYGLTNSGIDNAAHLGGVLGGRLCAFLVRPREERPIIRWSAVVGFVALVLMAFTVHVGAQVNLGIEAKLQHVTELAEEGKFEEARSELNALRKSYPKDPRPLYFLGMIELQEGNAEDAEKDLREVIRVAPSFGPAHGILGNILVEGGKLDEGIAELREAV